MPSSSQNDRSYKEPRNQGGPFHCNPATSIETLTEIISDVDLILLMSVNPGFGGQKFIQGTLDKIRRLSEMRKSTGTGFMIEVDGGVNLENAASLIEAGADILVAGSAVFGAEDIVERIREFKKL